MDKKLIDSAKTKIILFFILSVLFSTAASFLGLPGFFLVPFAVAFLSSAFYISNRSGKKVSFVFALLLILPDIVLAVPHFFGGTCTVVMAFILYRMAIARRNKGECIVYVSLAAFFFILVSILVYGFVISESSSLDGVIRYYSEQRELLREEFVNGFMNVYQTAPQPASDQLANFTREDITSLFDAFINLFVGMISVMAFTLCGISLKLFSRLSSFSYEEKNFFKTWRFIPSSIFSYTFLILVVLNLFGFGSGIVGLSIGNLYVLLFFVYAYFGYKVIADILGAKFGSKFTGYILVTIGAFVFFSFALQILSYFGAFTAISINKKLSLNNPGENGKN